MTLKRINTDLASWEEPNPIQGQPPTPRSARRGEVVDLPDAYIAQKKNEKILRHYPAPTGENLTVARYESVLLDPEGGDDVAAAAKADAEIARLEEELAQKRAQRPPAPLPWDTPTANEVVLSPATTGVRLVGDPEPLTQGVRLQAPQPAPEPAPEPVTVGKPEKSAKS